MKRILETCLCNAHQDNLVGFIIKNMCVISQSTYVDTHLIANVNAKS